MRSSFVLPALVLVALAGCKSQIQKCMETTDKTYERDVAACQDEACKAKAAKNKADYYAACQAAK